MLPTVGSPLNYSATSRKGSRTSCNPKSFVVKEIRSSLFLATSIIEDDASDEYHPMVDGYSRKNTINFECGRLKYSRVKGEWSLVHRPIPTPENSAQISRKRRIPDAMVIASLWPTSMQKHSVPPIDRKVKCSRCTNSKRKSKESDSLQSNASNGKVLDGEKDTLYEVANNFDIVCNDEVDNKTVQAAIPASMESRSKQRIPLESLPVSPPIELVRCILNGAEFISMMNGAIRDVESSIRNMANDAKGKIHDDKTTFKSKVHFWSRRMTKNLEQRSINLQPMIVALLAPTIGTNSQIMKQSSLSSLNTDKSNDTYFDRSSLETVMLEFIDECIRFAHIYTMDVISSWSPSWQVRANLLPEKVDSIIEDENRTSFKTGRKSSSTSRFMTNSVEKGSESYKGDVESVPFEAIKTIQEFVRECLTEVCEDMGKSNPIVVGGRKCSSITKEESSATTDSRILSEAPKRNTSRRSKTFALLTKKESVLEKQTQKRMKHSRSIPPAPSVLENTATGISRKTGIQTGTAYSESGSKRKRWDCSTSKLKRDLRDTAPKIGVRKEKDTYNCLDKCEIGPDKEKISPNSLYLFFERKRKRNKKKRTYETLSVDDNQARIGDSAFDDDGQQDEYEDLNRIPSPGAMSHADEMPMNTFVQFESRRSGESSIISAGRITDGQEYWHETGRHQSKPIDSLHELSKAPQSIPASHRSSNIISVGNEIHSRSTVTNSSDENSIGDDCLHRRTQRNNPNKAEWSINTGNEKKINQSYRDEECMKSGQAILHEKPTEVENDDFKGPRTKKDQEKESTNKTLKEDLSNGKSYERALKVAPSLPWVNLTHIGHISDYHGYKRKYEHFAPLRFGPVVDVRQQIEKTVSGKEKESGEESDEEVMKDNQDYEQAIKKYEILAKKEREMQMQIGIDSQQDSKEESLSDMMVIFSAPNDDDCFPLQKAHLPIKMNIENVFGIDIPQSSQPINNFRFVDDDEGALLNVEDDKEGIQRKRRSRSAQIAHQKKTSIRILTEILHTLDFIQRYNGKARCASEKAKEEVEEGDANDEDEEVCSTITKRKISSGSKRRKSERKGGRGNNPAKKKLASPVDPSFATLDTASLLESYDSIWKQFSLPYRLNGYSDIEVLKEEIQTILDRDNLLDEFFGDNEIISEEKVLARCIRRYSSKADQEKIEKKDFEEQQKLRQHEFEYYCRLRKIKKKSPQDVEWNGLLSRSIHYVRGVASLPTLTKGCNLKPICKICDPILETKRCDDIIFSPSFRRFGSNSYITSGSDRDSVWNLCSKLIAPSKRAELFSLMNLSELYHTLDFIIKYNNGLIVSTKGRK